MLLLFFFCLKMFGGASGDSFFLSSLYLFCFFLLPIERRFDFPFLFVRFSVKMSLIWISISLEFDLNSCFFYFEKCILGGEMLIVIDSVSSIFYDVFRAILVLCVFFAFFLWAHCSLFCDYCCCCSLVCFKYTKLMVILFLCCCFFFSIVGTFG